uniref:Triadin n=1 Tax=Callorhinchus milii TaxID=7868 RepID=A0A4W3IDM4_CALMI
MCIHNSRPATITIIDNKNGAVPTPVPKVPKKTVSDEFATTFSSPAAWFLVVALIVTWSAVAIVMFDLVDYKNLVGQIQPPLKKKAVLHPPAKRKGEIHPLSKRKDATQGKTINFVSNIFCSV